MKKGLRRFFAYCLCLTLLIATLGCAATETSRSTGAYIDDKTISTKVKAQLAADPITPATEIQVETYRGIVQLSGFVDSREIIDRAVDITRQVEGVTEVRNSLQLRGNP